MKSLEFCAVFGTNGELARRLVPDQKIGDELSATILIIPRVISYLRRSRLENLLQQGYTHHGDDFNAK